MLFSVGRTIILPDDEPHHPAPHPSGLAVRDAGHPDRLEVIHHPAPGVATDEPADDEHRDPKRLAETAKTGDPGAGRQNATPPRNSTTSWPASAKNVSAGAA
jgi:hypothetical protein